MKRLFTKKRIAIFATIPVLALGGIVAYAYWTTGGTGTGTAATDKGLSNLTITATETAPLVLNGTAGAVTLSVTNPNGYSVDLVGDTATINAGSISCDNPYYGSQSAMDTWFSLAGTIGGTDVIPAHAVNFSVTDSGITLALLDDTSHDQDICQNASVAFNITVAPEPGAH